MSFADTLILIRLRGIQASLQRIEQRLGLIGEAMSEIDDSLSTLEADVAATEAGHASTIALINGLSDKIDALIAAGGDPAATVAKIQELASRLRNTDQALAEAVAANPVPA